jgi:GT2 family glycosyltransferase
VAEQVEAGRGEADRPEGTRPGGLWCCALELSGERPVDAAVPFAGQRRARVLARLHGEPLGYLTVPTGPQGIEVDRVAALAHERHAPAIRAHLAAEGLPAADDGGDPSHSLPGPSDRCPNRAGDGGAVSVVVCTRDRPVELAACLRRLQALDPAPLEVVVVDNAPSDERTRAVVEEVAARDPRFRYVREPRAGLARARNRGLAEARGVHVAYTDDDVAVDPRWVQGVQRGFGRDPGVVCVTGLVCTAAVDGPAEEYFDARAASWSTRCSPELFDLGPHRRPGALYPYSPGIFGTGANFAFERDSLRRLGGFDEAFGAGTLTRGGEDLDVFLRVLRAGGVIAYEPAAMLWHHHRADDAALMSQLYGYGTGLSAFLTKCLAQRATRRELVARVLPGLRHMAAIRRRTTERVGRAADPADPAVESDAPATPRPTRALARELHGFLVGPLLYARARRAARR